MSQRKICLRKGVLQIEKVTMVNFNNTTLPPPIPTTNSNGTEHIPSYLAVWSSNEMAYYKYGIFGLIILISLIGNTIVVVTISMTDRLKKVTNFFLFNLAIANLLVTATCMPIHLASWFDPTVMLGQLTCKAMPFLQGTSVCCSIYTLTMMAIDRYMVILFPFRGRIKKQHCFIILLFIWSIAMLTVSPSLFVYRVGEYSGEKRCDEYGWSKQQALEFTYTLLVLTYFLPLLVLFFIYGRIFIFLWFRKIPGIGDMPRSVQVKMKKKSLKKKKLIEMLITVVVTFMLCNLPQNVMSLLWYHSQQTGWKPPIYIGIVSFHSEVLFYSNAAISPIVYGFLHGKMKEASFSILRWVFCCEKRPGDAYSYARNTRSSNVSSTYSTKYRYSIANVSKSAVNRSPTNNNICETKN